jgi:ribonuclease-3
VAKSETASLEAVLGHSFADPALLTQALTHASGVRGAGGGGGGGARGLDYERLEFLGDRVLGLVVAELLLERFPLAREGGLAPRLNALVRKETLADVAERLGLYPHIRKGGGDGPEGRGRQAILADTCEAVIAALFLDGGLAAARQFLRKHWEPLIKDLEEIPRDAKTSLQEWAQARGLSPGYTLLARLGPDHMPSFHVEARVPNYPAAVGEGPSKRAAEQAAAEAFLVRQGVWSPRTPIEAPVTPPTSAPPEQVQAPPAKKPRTGKPRKQKRR